MKGRSQVHCVKEKPEAHAPVVRILEFNVATIVSQGFQEPFWFEDFRSVGFKV